MTVVEQVRERLFEMADPEYRAFHSRLIPNIDPELVIGVRTPRLRAYAKEFAKDPGAEEYLATLPHRYYEENNLHAFLIEQIRDYDRLIAALDAFLPYVDNWATCDMMRPKAFKKHLPELLEQIKVWLNSEHPYAVRFGLGMLMTYFLDEDFKPEYLELAAQVRGEDYYIRMMVAWYFATALAKQYDCTLPYLEERKLGVWVHNKAIQKAVESYRITREQKAYLKTLKEKERAQMRQGGNG